MKDNALTTHSALIGHILHTPMTRDALCMLSREARKLRERYEYGRYSGVAFDVRAAIDYAIKHDMADNPYKIY